MVTLLDDEKLKNLLELKDADIVDIREPQEYAREHIPNSRNIPLSILKKQDLSEFKDKILLFYCKSGMRTKAHLNFLSSIEGKKIYCLTGGIDQWKRCQFPLSTNKKFPLEMMRQVQITIGCLILFTVLLSYFFSPYFLWLMSFIGLGLIIAGTTGFCGIAKLLIYMPWNRAFHSIS